MARSMECGLEAAVHRTRRNADRGGHGARDGPAGPECLLGPDGIAIMGGLTVATVLTIFFVPALMRVVQGQARRCAEPAAPSPRPLPLLRLQSDGDVALADMHITYERS